MAVRTAPLVGLLALGFLSAGCGGGAASTESRTVTETRVVTETTVSTVTAAPVVTSAYDYSRFRMPSNNVGCLFAAGVLRCDILSGLVPEPTSTCELDWTGFVLEGSGPAEPQCAGDTVYDASAPVLAYGQTWSRGRIACESREDGLRCANGDEHGFTLARSGSQTF